ncbi:similar to ankyrin 2,3/unc44 [Ectocarpus siliculosus]|uniref:Similar to ankyrin 2,3/unc44, partial n=1 Tax=Ectocarpus siliculosus TaxID=2880 RepID=D7FM65_ECTSI|nr:similar to ankyrin 2,3/unc44 [Ectocarpus siliculosus]|eukprot:CBJ29888.1 similar to ankyrin 2,3/unc44 [Ectocarpus siliculosus]
MSTHQDRKSTLHGTGDMILDLVCDLATPRQWTKWLRVPLEHAAGTGNAALVEKLLKVGANASAGWRGCDGRTLMHAGAEGGSEQVISMLTRAGAGKYINDQAPLSGLTPLHLAVSGGKLAATKVLMLAGADVNRLDADGVAPLHLALQHGHAELAQVLLLGGADADKQLRNGNFPIHLAARRGEDGVLRSLLHKGAKVDRRCSAGNTPLCHALDAGHISTVNVSLGWGCLWLEPTSKTCIAGRPPLCVSTFSISYFAAMLALLKLGADLHAKCPHNGMTALHTACHVVNPDAADLLLRWGADETAVDWNGATTSAVIPRIDEAPEENGPAILRLTKLLKFADQDRTWRRRGLLVMCRAHPETGPGSGCLQHYR